MAVRQFLEEFILLVLIALECQYFQKVGHYLWAVSNPGRYHRQIPIRHNNAGLRVGTGRCCISLAFNPKRIFSAVSCHVPKALFFIADGRYRRDKRRF